MTTPYDETALDDYIGALLDQALALKASDIHIEPVGAAEYRIRLRVDGLLRESAHCAPLLAARLLVCLKMRARLDIAERRRPQDGQFAFGPPDRRCSCRLSTLPTLRGEKLVLRLLRGTPENLTLERLGMPTAMRRRFLRILHRPQGLILLTGPTGSGKTMTLYSALNALAGDRLNICSVEDPVEIPLPGMTQCQVNVKAQLDFPVLLRALLRQDPDVIMVGEIRDRETAAMAVNSAQTGHLVLATLHALSAGDAARRLTQFGPRAGQVHSALLLVMAQRLVRLLCPRCRREVRTHDEPVVRLPPGWVPQRVWQAAGCEHCHQGYAGRRGIFHLLPSQPFARDKTYPGEGIADGTGQVADSAIGEAASIGAAPVSSGYLTAGGGRSVKNPGEISNGQRRRGPSGLWRAGLILAARGVTSLDELARVLGEPV
ncbi:GspE/PulE family protein [Acerihabitans arboris]|uniref:Type II secretion system protein GspE n=1 Tax=Acerihabitans arboris TaxID=2691583 RepID=A0A845S978_9GAMM|nr:ATPase, T2SS/T4P/T4SS family [Acerihabitans arboris]NDL61273.1 type II secretion system protein GspE [Acerihabitans arboris]